MRNLPAMTPPSDTLAGKGPTFDAPARQDAEISAPWAARLAPVVVGAALLWLAWKFDAGWLDRHFLPSFFRTREYELSALSLTRLGLVAAGLATLAWGGRILRYVGTLQSALILLAVLASFGTTEMILRTRSWHSAMATQMRREPIRRSDPQLGWLHYASHHGRDDFGGQWIEYAFDSHGYRVARAGAEARLAEPSIIFTGESVMVGYGLQWNEAIPAQVGQALGVEPINTAVTGYSTDQSFMRLKAELPRIRCPVAVVSIFMTSFLDRNLNTDRPHLDANLSLHPAHTAWRWAQLVQLMLPYRDEGTIDGGVAMTTATLRATQALAASRGALPIILVPAFMPESTAERAVRRRVLDDAGIDYLFVPLDRSWKIADDGHPDARADKAIANAIVTRLRKTRELKGIPPQCDTQH
jgi:hypothetical protein